ncbi:MAG: serine hydrolase, partial [Clostridia bacterium]|nr:serine hydrolase [Clostridia bacterium]
MINNYLCSQNAVFVKDMDTGEIIAEHNSKISFPSASVIKLFILSYFAGKEDTVIPVSRKDMVGTSIISELKLKSVTLKDALTFMISFSDNTATNLLINLAGMEEINKHIKEIGCKNTVLARKMMDFKAREEGRENMTSLEDCYTVMEILSKNEEAMEMLSTQKCLERLGRYIYRNVKMYTKPGDLNDVYNDVGILITPENNKVFAGVLCHKFDKPRAKRLCGKTGLVACKRETPVT